MKIIIYLASRDDVAQDNFMALASQRQNLIPSEEVYKAHLTCKDGVLANDNKDLFRDIRTDIKKEVRVEFIAHGRDNEPLQFLCLPPGRPPADKTP